MSQQCIYCQKYYSNKQSLTRHQNTCQDMKLYNLDKNQKEIHEKEIKSIKENYDKKIQSLKEQHEKEIQSLKEQLVEFKSQIFEIAKQPKTTTNNNNQKINIINQLAVYDITEEKAITEIDENFSNEVFHGGPKAIAKLVRDKIIIDPETGKPKLFLSDKNRLNAKYLTETGEIEIDLGCEKTYNMIKNPLLSANDRKFLELREQYIDPKTGRIKQEERDEYMLKTDIHSINEKAVKHKNRFVKSFL
jgi:hypothetical protein